MAPASVWGTLQSGSDIFPRQYVAASVSLFVSLPGVSCGMEGSERQQMEVRSICSPELLPTAEGCQELMLITVWHYVFSHGSWRPSQKQVCEGSRCVRWPGRTPKCPSPEYICPGILWLENAVLPWAGPDITVRATDPPWSPSLSGCLPGIFNERRRGD